MWPTVIFSTVIRGSKRGERHGALYTMDLNNGKYEIIHKWDTPSISFEGIGGDRGLRGIAFWNDHIYMMGSAELFILDRNLKLVESYRNKYLQLAHENTIIGDRLYIACTAWDAILKFDLKRGDFTQGIQVRNWKHLTFDPNEENPEVLKGGGLHLNNVVSKGTNLYWSGLRVPQVYRVGEERSELVFEGPLGTHNSRPYKGGWLTNHTYGERLYWTDGKEEWSVNTGDGFLRGMCHFGGNKIVVGNSFATIAVYRFGEAKPLEVYEAAGRPLNTVHGLEVWPW